MKKHILLVLLSFISSGCCFSKQNIILEEPDFKATGNVLVYDIENKSRANKLLRGALRKEGIKILKYARQYGLKINQKIDNKEHNINISEYTQYTGTPYILELTTSERTSVSCLAPFWGETAVYELTAEIANLKTKEVVFSAEASGFDKRCGYCEGKVFEKLAKMIADFWKK